MDMDGIFDCDCNEFFERKFSFVKKNDWILPNMVVENTPWNVNSLKSLKGALNSTKSLLNDKGSDWHEHTVKINKASFVIDAIKRIIQPEILTQAWCKFFEVISSFNLIPKNKLFMRSLHLCEAPGAFISALNYYLCVNHPSIYWEWMANALNPYYEGHSIRNVVVDDRLLFPTLKHWYFGKDNDGDVTDLSYIKDLCSTVEKSGLFDLITADGSIDCLDNPGEQELLVEKLHFSEVFIALNCLLPEGCFVLKKFTFFECTTICQLYLLNCVFEQVHVFKPFTSRHSNSEVYVICIGFQSSELLTNILQQYKDAYSRDSTVAFFPQSLVPRSFIQQVEECMKLFTGLQIKAIKENLFLYPLHNDLIIEKLNKLKHKCAEEYIEKYSVGSSPVYDAFKLFSKNKVLTSFIYESHKNLKSLYFEGIGDTFNNVMKFPSMDWHDKLLDVEKRISKCFPNSRKRTYEKIDWQFPWKELRSRMKKKSYQNWIIYGKKVTCIRNSKFCYPILLHLWNRISLDPKVDLLSHMKFESNSLTDAFDSIFSEEKLSSQSIGIISVSQKCNESDSLLLHLKQSLDFKVSWYLNMDDDSKTKTTIPSENKIVYINTTVWQNSLHNECTIKRSLTEGLSWALECFKEGDAFLLCIQSVLTRYTAGLIFMLISLFEKFTTVVPEQFAPAYMGQVWIFRNYQQTNWACNVFQYLKVINELKLSEEKEVLEIVPLTSLFHTSFQVYLRNINNKYLLQKLQSLIAVEKRKMLITV